MNTATCPQCAAPLPGGDDGCPRCLMSGFLLHETEAAPLEGVRFGDYELRGRIAAGGMGVVYEAWQISLRRTVALKMMKSGQLADAAERQRFATEAEAVAALEHPGIVPIYDIGECDEQPFYTMRLVEGGRSGVELSRAPQPDYRGLAGTLAEVADAVHFAHQRGILHRDLKPANILLDAAGNPFIIDFGLAKFTGGDATQTLSGTVLGTPAYMAPEVATAGSRAATIAADVYALGTILYEWLTGRPPFMAESTVELLRRISVEEPRPPSALIPRLPHDLETICLKCLQKQPDKRYATSAALAADLRHWLAAEPIAARPVSAWERAARWCRRRPSLTALLVLAALAPAGFIFQERRANIKLAAERDIARTAATLASEAETKALASARMARHEAYYAQITLAARALESQDYSTAWRSLAAWLPGKPFAGEQNAAQDLRGFEWRWLWQRARGASRTTFAAHHAGVNTVTWSRDGHYAASSGADGVVTLWDASAERLLRSAVDPGNAHPLPGYTDTFAELPHDFVRYSVAISPDNQALLTCSIRRLRLCDAASGQERWSLPLTDNTTAAIFSPVDARVALIIPHPSNATPELRLIDVTTGQLTTVLANVRVDAVCFTRDGSRIVRWGSDDRRFWIQKIPDGEVLTSFGIAGLEDFHTECMALTADGGTLAACNLHQRTIELFDVARGQRAGALTVHAGRCYALAISPDGQLLASGGTDQTIHLWDLATRQEIRQLHGHRAGIRALDFSPDGRRLVSGGHDGTVRFWDVAAPAELPDLTNIAGVFAFSPDGRRLVTQSKDGPATASLWELPARRKLREWTTPSFQSAVFLPGGTLLTASTGSADEPPCVRTFADGDGAAADDRVQVFPQESLAPCTAIALSPDGQFTVTGHKDGTVTLRETRTARLLHEEAQACKASIGYSSRRTVAALNPLVFSADGHTLATASYDAASVRTWTLPDFRPLGSYFAGAIYEMPLALSPDGRQLTFSGLLEGNSINLRDAAFQQPAISLEGHHDFQFAVAWSPDGRTLASGGRDGLLKLWHLLTRREIATILTLPEQARFSHLAFSPDGTWLGVSDTEGTLRLFPAPTPVETDGAR